MGFVAIVSIFLILTLNPSPKFLSRRVWSHGLVFAFLALVMADLSGGWVRLGLYRDHVLGFGAAPFFPNQCADRVLNEFPDRRVLTTVENGGYLLFRWGGKKSVFVDGFFAPHRGTLLDDYNRARNQGNPNLLADKYRADLAIVGLRDMQWMQALVRSSQWSPRFFDGGSVVFERVWGDPPPFDILISVTSLERLPRYMQLLWGKTLVDIMQSWRDEGAHQRITRVNQAYHPHLKAVQRILAQQQ